MEQFDVDPYRFTGGRLISVPTSRAWQSLRDDSASFGDHSAGPFLTYADLAHTPEDGRRFELIDGRLHVSPSPTTRHQRVAFVLGMVLERQLPAGLVVVLDTDVVLDPGKDQNVLRPDVYVANREAVRDLQQGALAVSNCLLVVEIESPSTAEYDRSTKARKYAGAGVPNFWRVEFISPGWDQSAVIIAHTLERGTYRETAHVTAGHSFESRVPFDLSFDPAVLTD